MTAFNLSAWPKATPRKEEEYIPPKGINSHIGRQRKVEEFEDAYTIATRAEKTLKESGADINEEIFVDKAGRSIPWHELNGETETLVNRDERTITREEKQDKLLAENSEDELNNGPTNAELKVELRNAKANDYDIHSHVDVFRNKVGQKKHHTKLTSKAKESGIVFKEDERKYLDKKINNPGLYKDYNPKLNAGAPGNVKERRRQKRKEHEEMNWQQ